MAGESAGRLTPIGERGVAGDSRAGVGVWVGVGLGVAGVAVFRPVTGRASSVVGWGRREYGVVGTGHSVAARSVGKMAGGEMDGRGVGLAVGEGVAGGGRVGVSGVEQAAVRKQNSRIPNRVRRFFMGMPYAPSTPAAAFLAVR